MGHHYSPVHGCCRAFRPDCGCSDSYAGSVAAHVMKRYQRPSGAPTPTIDEASMSDVSAEELRQFVQDFEQQQQQQQILAQPCCGPATRPESPNTGSERVSGTASAVRKVSDDDGDSDGDGDETAGGQRVQCPASEARSALPQWDSPDWQASAHGPQDSHPAFPEGGENMQVWPEAAAATRDTDQGALSALLEHQAPTTAIQARMHDHLFRSSRSTRPTHHPHQAQHQAATGSHANSSARVGPPHHHHNKHQHNQHHNPYPPQALIGEPRSHLHFDTVTHTYTHNLNFLDDPQASQLEIQALPVRRTVPLHLDLVTTASREPEPESEPEQVPASAPPPPLSSVNSDQASTKSQTSPGPAPAAMPPSLSPAPAAAAAAMVVDQQVAQLRSQASASSHLPSATASPAPAIRASPFQASASEGRRDTSAAQPHSYAVAAATVGTQWLHPGVPQDSTLSGSDADSDDRAVVDDATGLGLYNDSTAAASPFQAQASESGPWKHALSETQDTSSALPSAASPPQRQRNLRQQQHHRTRNPPIATPAIRVVNDPDLFSGLEPHHQPQQHLHQPQEPTQDSTDITADTYYPVASLSPAGASHPFQEPAQPYYAAVPPRLSSTGSSSQQPQHLMPADQQEMQTPPRSPLDHHLMSIDVNGLQLTRKRSHSAMSTDHPPDEMHHLHHANHHRSPSLHSMGEPRSPQPEGFSPRARTIKRDDPPVNTDGKYFCNYAAECDGQIFDRKCEWSKHMDKHDRPYRCPHPLCAKLQGFTYSGGLLRHEREVHGKHGGPKAQLMCPFPNCKRHSGKGFTRKENLNEHVRRVHESRSQNTTLLPLKRDVSDVLAGADNAETPGSRISEALTSDSAISPELKRRRTLTGLEGGSEDVEDLRQEIIRLRAENAEKDRRLMHMEQKMEEADQRREDEMNQMRALHEEMRQMQHTQVAT